REPAAGPAAATAGRAAPGRPGRAGTRPGEGVRRRDHGAADLPGVGVGLVPDPAAQPGERGDRAAHPGIRTAGRGTATCSAAAATAAAAGGTAAVRTPTAGTAPAGTTARAGAPRGAARWFAQRHRGAADAHADDRGAGLAHRRRRRLVGR